MIRAKDEVRATEAESDTLISLAAAIGAGCGPCVERIVRLAIRGGISTRSIERTLVVTGRLRQIDCFMECVGHEVVFRMGSSIRSAERILADSNRVDDQESACAGPAETKK